MRYLFIAFFTMVTALASVPERAQAQAPSQACKNWFASGKPVTGDPQDSQMALFEPDCYAWRLFVAFNWPAKPGTCEADISRKLGDDGGVVWETWIAKSNVYLKDAVAPRTWAANCGADLAKRLAPTAQFQAALESFPAVPGFQRPENAITTTADEEVRLNQSAFEFIIANRLYSLTEQRRLAAAKQLQVEFPIAAKEAKAHWIKLDDPADYSRYHTGKDAAGNVYGLLALHITTKDLPKWFWATWEHMDNKTRWANSHSAQFAGWSVRPRDEFACQGKPIDCEEFPRGIGLDGTKWQNYRLKATQVDWVDEFGAPSIAVNSKIEGGFVQNQSSCISCHALALIGDKGGPMPYRIFKTPPIDGRLPNFIGVVGEVDRLPREQPSSNFLQLDFVWSLRNACPEPSDPNRAAGTHCR